MAKRSDFAQKLLDDLRLRKERMAAPHSSDPSSTTTAIDAYAYSKQTYRGSKERKQSGTTGSRAGNSYNGPNARNISNSVEVSHIVPFGRDQRPAQIDLSMVLAFALENGGILRRLDSAGNNSMLTFLNQIGKGSVEFRKVERRSTTDRHKSSTSPFPALSHLHIKEISKGADKLNQILKACSKSNNFNRYSVEMGKELLKGARDLEESLLMLVNMQKASECMTAPRRKSKITLLEDDNDNDNDSNTVMATEQKQLELPMFSFDKPSRNSLARTGANQTLAAVTYLKDASNSSQALTTSNSISHSRRASYDLDVKTTGTFTGQKNSSKSKPEKGRIPSVIVKLMGLDELPENVDPKYSTHKDSSSTMAVEKKNIDAQNLTQQSSKQKVMQAHKSRVVQDTAVLLQAQKHPPNWSSNPEGELPNRKLLWKDLKVTNSVPSSAETPVKMKHSNITLSNQNTGRQKDVIEKERKHDNTKQREQRGTEKSKMKEPVDELQQIISRKQMRPQAVVTVQEKTEYKASKRLIQNQQKPHSHLGVQQSHMLRRSEPQEEKEWQRAKQNMQVRKQKGNEVMSKISLKPRHDAINLRQRQHIRHSKQDPRESIDALPSKWLEDNKEHEEYVREESSMSLPVRAQGSTKKNSGQNSSMKYLASELNGALPFLEENRVHAPVERKAKYTDMRRSDIASKMNEIMTRRNESLNNHVESLKHLNSAMQVIKDREHDLHGSEHDLQGSPRGAEQVRGRRVQEPEAGITKSSELDASFQPLDMAQDLQMENEKASTLKGAVGDEGLTTKEPAIVASSDSRQRITPVDIKDQQCQAQMLGEEEDILDEISSDAIKRTQGGNEISCHSKLKQNKISETKTQEPLTERENNLKRILMKSQHFLDTSEALLKLNISFGILNAGGHNCLDEDSKLVLDCGYELMKRKGTRQELSVHPYVKISITSTKINSLDYLVKQIDKDFEVLKVLGRNGEKVCNAEDYLPEMIESDIHDRYPDMNCMWDSGWNENAHAFLEKDDVVRDVERCVFNRLIDEIVQDLFHV